MTPGKELELLDSTAAGLDLVLREAWDELRAKIRAGVDPRDAVAAALESFRGDMAETLSAAFSAMLGGAVGSAPGVDLEAGSVRLSVRFYAQASEVSAVVTTLVQEHARGFADARALALELFEGYGFREPGAEPLQISRRNPKLPKYLREALLPDRELERGFARAYARIQVDRLSTPALKAAYGQVLEAIEGLEVGRGAKVLENSLRIAFYERMRYFATRIAQTELHRAYMLREAGLLLADADLEFVQVRRAPGRGDPCICTLYTGRDAFGLGPGVYPKARAPLPPYHPYCRCIVAPRLDLTGAKAKPEDPAADRSFLSRLGEPVAARVIGSRAKLDRVLAGRSADEVYNSTKPEQYRVRKIGEV